MGNPFLNKKPLLFVIVIPALLLTLTGQGNTQQPVPPTGVIDETLTNGVFEISFLYGNTVSNPYDPDIIEVNGFITLPDGQTVCLPAFWYEGYTRSLVGQDEVLIPDGENAWKLRFTPRDAGIYHYYIEIKDRESDVSVRIPETGSSSFTVSAGNSKGFLQPSDEDPAYLEYDTGEFFFGIGHNLCGWEWPGRYDSEAWNGTDNSRGTYEYDEWLGKMEENGANLTQFDFCESDQLEWTYHPSEFPFSDSWNGLVHYNQQTAWKMDYRITQAEDKGIFFRLTLLHWEDFDGENDQAPNWGWKRNPYNRSNGGPVTTVAGFFSDPKAVSLYKKQVRYIIARWGYSKNLLCWELWNEVDAPGLWSGSFKTHANAIKGWHGRISEYIDDLDINNHPVTTSFADSFNDPKIWNMEGIDLTTLHRYTYYNSSYGDRQFDTVKTVHDLIAKRFSDTAKPVIIGEFALTPGGDIQRVYDQEGIAFHNQLWASLMSSGAATAMHWNWGSYIHVHNLYEHYQPISLFLAGEDLRSTESFHNISRKKEPLLYIGLKSQDKAYVWIQDRRHNYESVHGGYTPRSFSGEKLILAGLADGTYTADYYDTYTGDIMLTETVMVSSGKLTLNLPDFTKDLAVKIH